MAKVKDGAGVSSKNKLTKKMKPKKKSKKKLYTPFTCDICSKQFTDKYLLQTHKQTHSTTFAYACDECDFRCKVSKYLARHKRRRHRDTKSQKCDVCDKRFHFPSGLAKHMLVHTGEKPHKCAECGKGFNTTYSLNTHRLIHTDEKPFQCPHCEYACRDSSTLRKHRAKHEGTEQAYRCTTCGKTMKSKWQLKNHVAEKHLNLDVKKHFCSVCNRGFKVKGALNKHVRVVHDRSEGGACGVCGVRLADRANLAAHMLRHVPLRPYGCAHGGCGKSYKDLSSLRKHEILHRPEEHYRCEICARLFSRRERLEQHLRQHQPRVKNQECHYCGTSFYNKRYLARHISLKHSVKRKKYVCDMCDLETYNKPSIVMHIKYGHGNKLDRSCNMCDKKYRTSKFLRLHYARAHGVHCTTKPKNDKIEIKEEPLDDQMSIDLFEVEKEEVLEDLNPSDTEAHDSYIQNDGETDLTNCSIQNDPETHVESPSVHKHSASYTPTDDLNASDFITPSDLVIDAHDNDNNSLNDKTNSYYDEVNFQNDNNIWNNDINNSSNDDVNLYNNSNLNNDKNNSRNDGVNLHNDENNSFNDKVNFHNDSNLNKDENNSQNDGANLNNDENNSHNDGVTLHNDENNLFNDKVNFHNDSNFNKDNSHNVGGNLNNDENNSFHDKVNLHNDSKLNKDEHNSHNDGVNLHNDNGDRNNDENSSFNDDLDSQDIAIRIIEDNRKVLKKVPEAVFDHHFIQRVGVEKGRAAPAPEQKPKPYLLDKKLQEAAKNSLRQLLSDARRRRAAKCVERTRRQYNERMRAALGRAAEQPRAGNLKINYFNNNKPAEESKNDRRRDDTTDDGDDESIDDDTITNNDSDNKLEKLRSTGDRTKIIHNDTLVNDKDCGNDITSHDKDPSNDITNNESKHTMTRSKSRRCRSKKKTKRNDPANDTTSNDKDPDNDVENGDKDSIKDVNLASESEYEEKSEPSDFEDEDEFKMNQNKYKHKLNFNTHQCYVCFKLFQTKEQLFEHCSDHFDVCNASTLTKCPLCSYVSKSKLSGHLKLVHGITVKLPYTQMKDKRDNNNGSRYYYSVNSSRIKDIEIIPSVKNLNKIAYVNLDKQNRERKDKLVAKAKLVKKGKEWVVEQEKIDVNADYMLPELVDEEKKTSDKGVKITEEPCEDYVDRLKKLSRVAKKNGKKMLFPCEYCEKICQTAAALKLHNRKHDPNKKPFKKKIWKHKQKEGLQPKTTKKPRVVTNTYNRVAKPQPIKNNHKCDPELKEFYEKNIRGGDIEFWQFLKIYNKMGRENVTEFADLETRTDFGIHVNDTTEDVAENNDVGDTNDDAGEVNESVREMNEVGNSNDIGDAINDKFEKTNEIVNKTKGNVVKTNDVVNKINKSVFKRTIRMSKKDYARRNEIKNKMREKVACEQQSQQIAG